MVFLEMGPYLRVPVWLVCDSIDELHHVYLA